jgi:hypothetical protein
MILPDRNGRAAPLRQRYIAESTLAWSKYRAVYARASGFAEFSGLAVLDHVYSSILMIVQFSKARWAGILSILCFFLAPALAQAGLVTIGYLSFSENEDGSSAQFSLSDISGVDFENAELDVRYSPGGVGGDAGPMTIFSGGTHVVVPGGNYYDWGEATGVIGALTFSVGTTNYLASTGLFQDFLYSDSQAYLGPGQTQQIAVTVDAIVVSPETNTLFTMSIGVIILAYLRRRRFGRFLQSSVRSL